MKSKQVETFVETMMGIIELLRKKVLIINNINLYHTN